MQDINNNINLKTILVVDDNPENIHVLSGILRPYYKVKAAINGQLALKIAMGPDKPNMILLDIMMPEIDGYSVCKELKSMPKTADIPIIFVSAKSDVEDEKRGFSLGAVDYITKPVSPPLVLARVKTYLNLCDQKTHLAELVSERTVELEQTRMAIIQSLGRAAEFKDNETGMHVVRMSWYARFIALHHTQNEKWAEALFNAAPMHDVGKIGIPDKILLKPDALNAQEWAEMKRHVDYGVIILGQHESELLNLAREVAHYHHEKWDGSGYPEGLKGEEIPLSARIVAVADVFDALTSERPYKKAWTVEAALALLEEQSGKHFDPQLVIAFQQCITQVLEIKHRYND